MKKIIYSAMAVAMLATTSCQDDLVNSFVGEEATVEFSISTPEIATRAFSDGLSATNLQYAIYDADGNELTALRKIDGTINGKTSIRLELKNNKSYQMVVWAAAPNAPYTVDFSDKTMQVDYTNATCNDESRDAFYAYTTFTVNNHTTVDVELRRPFAQLNIGANDFDAAQNSGYAPTESKVTVDNVYSTFNFATGNVGAPQTVTFDYANLPQNEEFPVEGNDYLAMNYLLVGADQELHNVTFEHKNNKEGDSKTIGSVPLKRNYRTNIYGGLLTSTTDIHIEIKPAYKNNALEAWDGVSVSRPTYDASTKTYYISHAAELAWIAQLANGTLPAEFRSVAGLHNFDGETIKLECDIDLNEKAWTPISMPTELTPSNTFYGTFDGNGYTIHGLKVENSKAAGLFGYIYGATIKNVTIADATLNSNHYAGGIVAWVLNNKGNQPRPMIIENCHVINSTIVSTPELVNGDYDNGDKAGGLVGYYLTDQVEQGAVIKNCSVENTTVKAYRDLGGLLGYAKGAALVNCTTKNVTVSQDDTNGYQSSTPTTVDEFIGRNEEGNTIDGRDYVANGITYTQENKTYYIISDKGLAYISALVDGGDTFAGKTIKLDVDVDLSEENWDPIGYNDADDKKVKAFEGVFDGQNHTIKGAHITGDHCFNGAVYGSKEGWGLFSVVDGATIKNLKVDGATFGSYTVITGTIAGYANNTTFENIEIKNTKIAGYNWYTGGVVGWAAGECTTFKNVNLDETVAVGTLWDSHGQNAGGIAGGVSSSAEITIEDCNIACVMDVINDVTS
ncbi:MAG: DUF6562 domain-containing protein, partial [Muribaculaceae bacterium]|nr:DUF6562 domain-containing protein [Muribaculaceae bacterium]